MASQRLFMLGVVLLLFGIQLRMVDTYVLNERTSRLIDKQISRSRSSSLYTTQPTSLESYDSPFDELAGDLASVSAAPPKKFSPPRWLGLSLISVGAVLILTHPCYRS